MLMLPGLALDEPARLAAVLRYRVLDTAPEAAFDRITALVQSILGVPLSGVSLIDRDRQWHKSQQGGLSSELERESSFCAHTIRRTAPMIVPDATLDARFAGNPGVLGPPYIRSYAGVPLRTPDGHNVGALCAIDRVPREFDASQIAILSSFADVVVDELELRLIGRADELTGAMSRRGIVAQLDRAFARFGRANEPAALVAIDLDRFRAVNDSHGHAVGDQVLVAVARALRGEMRAADSLGRVGGKAFAVVLPRTDAESAMAAAERYRAIVAAVPVPAHPGLAITASFGVAAVTPDMPDVATWRNHAERALHAAKRGGGDRCSTPL